MDRVVRATLWLSFPFNLLAAALLANPTTSLAQVIGVPAQVPSLYSLALGFLVCQFGFTYAWLALRKSIHPPLLAFCAIGKSGVFAIVLLLWATADISGRLLSMASADLLLALVWFRWLFNSRSSTVVSSGE